MPPAALVLDPSQVAEQHLAAGGERVQADRPGRGRHGPAGASAPEDGAQLAGLPVAKLAALIDATLAAYQTPGRRHLRRAATGRPADTARSRILDVLSGKPYIADVGRTSASGRRNAVRRARLLAQLTQAELAASVGVTRQTIVAVEAGDYAPSVYLALAIAERLGSTVEELFGQPATTSAVDVQGKG